MGVSVTLCVKGFHEIRLFAVLQSVCVHLKSRAWTFAQCGALVELACFAEFIDRVCGGRSLLLCGTNLASCANALCKQSSKPLDSAEQMSGPDSAAVRLGCVLA